MILVSLGSSQFDFSRLLRAIDNLIKNGLIKDTTINAQIGMTVYDSQYMNCFPMISDVEFKRMVCEADLIITHAGVGCIMSAMRLRKKTIIFPRLKEYHEHLDNHQLEIAKFFSEQRYLLLATNEEELKNCIQNIDTFEPRCYEPNGKINELLREKLNEWGI